MSFIRSFALASAVTAFTGASLAACGDSGSGGGGAAATGSEEQQIRAAARALARLRPPGDAKRICELLTARSEAQIAGLAGAPDDHCVGVLRTAGPGFELSARQIDGAKLTVRADRALLVYGANEGRLGMRKVDGEWQVDDLLATTLEGPVRPADAALTEGGDEQQVRAVLRTVSDAAGDRDAARVCGLLGAGAEAQVLAGVLVTELNRSPGINGKVDVRSCPQALRRLWRADDGGPEALTGLAVLASSRAKVAIRDDLATVTDAAGDEARLVREEGRWLMGPNEGSLGGGAAP
jgi:hypothetical protein